MSRIAIFLDRDGVVNQERKDYVKSISEFKIFESVPSAINLLKKNGFLIILVTNQSAINRGLITTDILNEIHDYLQDYLSKYNATIDAIYFCPHKPDENCDCRKPKPGLILKAAKELDIDLTQSWFIGDSQSDIDAAKIVGCKSFLVDEKRNLNEAVQEILNYQKN